MNKLPANLDAPYLGVNDAAYVSGTSRCFIREGIRNGTIAHIKSGTAYRVCMKQLFELLDTMAAESLKGGLGGGETQIT